MSVRSWPNVWMNIAKLIADQRGYDPRLKVAAVIVPEDNSSILSFGYNGNSPGEPNVPDSLDEGKSGFIHAELNACLMCPDTHKKKIMYVTHSPCLMCSKVIVRSEISRVVYDIEYRDTSGLALLKRAGIEVFSLKELLGKAS